MDVFFLIYTFCFVKLKFFFEKYHIRIFFLFFFLENLYLTLIYWGKKNCLSLKS